MAEQLKVFDPNTFELYEMGARNLQSNLNGQKVPVSAGNGIYTQEGCDDGDMEFDYPLIPLDKNDKWAKVFSLGLGVWENVPVKLRPRLTGEYRVPANGETYGYGPIKYFSVEVATNRANPAILFTTKPKTTREHLEAIVGAWHDPFEQPHVVDFVDRITAAKQHLAATGSADTEGEK